MKIRSFQRLGRQAMLGGGSLAGLLLGWTGAGSLSAQPTIQNGAQPAAVQNAPAVQRTYLNKKDVQLPIRITESARTSIKEIQLYSKNHVSAPWALYDKAGPAQAAFTFKAPTDGEYWFTMVTVDKQGRSVPSDLRNEPAGLSIVIDTQAPKVEMTNLGTSPEGQLIQIDVADANLDTGRLRFSYQAGDKGFRLLEPMTGRSNVYCIPAQAVCSGLMQVIAEDMAGNQTTRQEHLNQMKSTQNRTSNLQPAAGSAQTEPKAPNELPRGVKAAPALSVSETPTVPKIAPQTPDHPTMPRPDGRDGPHWTDQRSGEPTKPGSEKRDAIVDGGVTQASCNIVNGSAMPQRKTPTPANNAAPKRQIVNSAKVSLNYQIEDAAPTSVAQVEVWLTRDEGKSWHKHSEVKGHKSPIDVQLPGDGVYGLLLIPSGGATAATPPGAGDLPDTVWIEVDTTKPTLQINHVETSHDKGQAVVQIRWAAQDKNLANAPVELSFAATSQGPWLPIAKGLPATGQHLWAPPAGLGTQAHLRLIASDSAGNTATVCIMLEPGAITEPVQPRVRIRNVSTDAGGLQLVPPQQ